MNDEAARLKAEADRTEYELVESMIASVQALLMLQPAVQPHLSHEVAAVMRNSPDFRVIVDWSIDGSGRIMILAIDGTGEPTHVLRKLNATPDRTGVSH